MTEREKQLLELVEKQAKIIEAQAAKIEALEIKVDQLTRKLYGKSSEQLNKDQLQLELDGIKKIEAVSPEELKQKDQELAAKEPKKPRKPSRPKLPDDLPVETEVIIPLEVQANPEAFEKLDEKVTERLDIEPARLTLKRTIRPSYKAKTTSDILRSPLPPCLLEKSIITPSLLSYILCSKYCDHLPLERQQTIFQRRYGVQLQKSTLCDWVALGAEYLEPLYNKLLDELIATGNIQADETPIQYLTKTEGSKQGYFWVYTNQNVGVIYDWQTGRSTKCLNSMLSKSDKQFKGLLQCDGYGVYDSFAKKNPKIKLLGCWVHARRKFYEAREQDKDAYKVLHYIARLYAQERHYKKWLAQANHPPEAIRFYRKRYSRNILKELKALLKRMHRVHLSSTLLGSAVDYTLNQWEKLARSVSCSHFDLDNNHAENSVRPLKVGVKNWLFIGAEHAGKRSAVIYSLIENIRRGGRDPFAYLKEVFDRLIIMTNQDDLTPLMPKAWLERQKAREQELATSTTPEQGAA